MPHAHLCPSAPLPPAQPPPSESEHLCLTEGLWYRKASVPHLPHLPSSPRCLFFAPHGGSHCLLPLHLPASALTLWEACCLEGQPLPCLSSYLLLTYPPPPLPLRKEALHTVEGHLPLCGLPPLTEVPNSPHRGRHLHLLSPTFLPHCTAHCTATSHPLCRWPRLGGPGPHLPHTLIHLPGKRPLPYSFTGGEYAYLPLKRNTRRPERPRKMPTGGALPLPHLHCRHLLLPARHTTAPLCCRTPASAHLPLGVHCLCLCINSPPTYCRRGPTPPGSACPQSASITQAEEVKAERQSGISLHHTCLHLCHLWKEGPLLNFLPSLLLFCTFTLSSLHCTCLHTGRLHCRRGHCATPLHRRGICTPAAHTITWALHTLTSFTCTLHLTGKVGRKEVYSTHPRKGGGGMVEGMKEEVEEAGGAPPLSYHSPAPHLCTLHSLFLPPHTGPGQATPSPASPPHAHTAHCLNFHLPSLPPLHSPSFCHGGEQTSHCTFLLPQEAHLPGKGHTCTPHTRLGSPPRLTPTQGRYTFAPCLCTLHLLHTRWNLCTHHT